MQTPHLRRGQILIQQHRYADAERELGMALASDPEDAWAHALLAICLVHRKAYAEGGARIQQAIQFAPDSAEIRQLAGRVQLERNAYDDAERLFSEAIALDPHRPAPFAGRAASHAARKQWRKALEDCARALEFDPEDTEAINIRALANRGLGNSADGLADVEYALRVDPNDAHSHANLGWSYLQKGELKLAERHFREALRIDPTLEWARVGVLETTKAKFPVYRWVLNYFLWMARFTGKAQMAIIIGAWVAYQVVRAAARANPDLAPVLQPVIWFYILFCVMTWFIQPLANATLLLHPFARLALNRREKTEALVVGSLFTLVLGLVVVAAFEPTGLALVLAVAIGIPALPLAMSWKFEHPKPRAMMWAATGAVLLAEVAFFSRLMLDSVPAGLSGLVDLGAQLFVFSPLAILLLTNALAAKDWRLD